eukprot:scaffold23173_cov78-Phaeocystis_antarctica.AAC.1
MKATSSATGVRSAKWRDAAPLSESVASHVTPAKVALVHDLAARSIISKRPVVRANRAPASRENALNLSSSAVRFFGLGGYTLQAIAPARMQPSNPERNSSEGVYAIITRSLGAHPLESSSSQTAPAAAHSSAQVSVSVTRHLESTHENSLCSGHSLTFRAKLPRMVACGGSSAT